MVIPDCKAWIKWPVLSNPVVSTSLILMVNKLVSSLHGAPLWEKEKGMYEISTTMSDLHKEAWLCWDLPCRFSDLQRLQCLEKWAILCSIAMWAVMLQCPLINNSMSYFSQGFQSSWGQNLKDCQAVGVKITGTERNRKRWQSTFERSKHMDSHW